ncbi:Pre-mRNA-splicing factor rse1 [Neolecta irregularis DAH-3]|uniref:Pre-mRNA-splicing factor rse1 n=1 Tax=Neolecta irregularis (strain DAH-3) TaxID=1198029 RepID=A0A1U7LUN0_NEOID|nr:Pre-mRNA-splicing factor rse1 [Neolecta irregularis DAH-3]|eukprot:OLL26221.1 Pre-mRNA-splicing factor rse1 [Neolecta irregularis DAH-3]
MADSTSVANHPTDGTRWAAGWISNPPTHLPETVEVTDTGSLSSTPTIAVQQLGQDALIQIHPGGIRYIRADGKMVDWKTPAQ